MRKIFDFSGKEGCEDIFIKTWEEFRDALAHKKFSFDEVGKAKKYNFLKAYDDIFHKNSCINYNTVTIKELKERLIGRGTILNKTESLNYERFITKKEFIKKDNRFSPPGVEWLYLAIGTEADIHQCSQAECRTKSGNRFGFCHFAFDDNQLDLKIVDLTIADNISYNEINRKLEKCSEEPYNKLNEIFYPKWYLELLLFHSIPTFSNDKKIIIDAADDNIKDAIIEWTVYTYSKLLSEQIFKPLSEVDDKSIMYAPFQTMAQYYISLGYSGIIYGSTVCDNGKNLVLFNKDIATPTGKIEDYII